MEKSTRIVAQVYGYAVCLVVVITFLISTTALINAIIDRSDPIHSGWTPAGSPSLASYDNYKLDVMKSTQKETDGKDNFNPDEQTLKAMYEAARNDKIQLANHQANKAILIGALINLICIILFFTHWKWLSRLMRIQKYPNSTVL
jgi:hypothetical protein